MKDRTTRIFEAIGMISSAGCMSFSKISCQAVRCFYEWRMQSNPGLGLNPGSLRIKPTPYQLGILTWAAILRGLRNHPLLSSEGKQM